VRQFSDCLIGWNSVHKVSLFVKGMQYFLKASKKLSIPNWLVAGFRLNDACKILACRSNCYPSQIMAFSDSGSRSPTLKISLTSFSQLSKTAAFLHLPVPSFFSNLGGFNLLFPKQVLVVESPVPDLLNGVLDCLVDLGLLEPWSESSEWLGSDPSSSDILTLVGVL